MDDLTWCIQRVKPIERWKNIFQFAKDIELWFIALATFFIALSAFYFMTGHEAKALDLVSSGLTVALAIWGAASRFRPATIFGRFWFGFTLLSALILNTYFHSFLIIVLTHNQYQPQVSTVTQLIDYDYEIAGGPYARTKIMDQNLVMLVGIVAYVAHL